MHAGDVPLHAHSKFVRLLRHSNSVVTHPGQQKLGPTGHWSPQDVVEHAVPLAETQRYGAAVNLAIDRVAKLWGLPVSNSQKSRFCLRQALMNQLPADHPGAVTYEPELNIISSIHNKSLLGDNQPTLLSGCGQLPEVQACL